MADEYRVQLDMYNGPMDLLLYLIRRDEIDIYDIPIVKITDQYVTYVELLETIDPNAAGEFLVLATMLMEVKSRLLLPKPPPESQEEFTDPRLELVRQLLEYKKFKDAADQLRSAAEEQARRFARQPPEIKPELEGDVEIDSLHMWDLVEAFREVLAKTGRLEPHEIQYDDTPISLHAADIIDRLEREGGSMTFTNVFEGRTRSECIGLFLALLELIRQRRIRAEQDEPFAPIFVHLLDATPIDDPDDEGATFGAPFSLSTIGEEPEAGDYQPAEPDDDETTDDVTINDESDDDEIALMPEDDDDLDGFGDMPEVPELSTDPTDQAQELEPTIEEPRTEDDGHQEANSPSGIEPRNAGDAGDPPVANPPN